MSLIILLHRNDQSRPIETESRRSHQKNEKHGKTSGVFDKDFVCYIGPKGAETGLKFGREKLENGLAKGIKIDGQIIEAGTRTRI